MKTQGRIQKILSIASFTCASLFSHAAVPPPQITIELNKVKQVTSGKKEFNSEDVAKIIPIDLQPGQSESEISLIIVDRGLDSVAKEDLFKNSELGKTAEALEHSMQADISLGGKKDDPNAIHHNLNFQVQAFEQKAYMRYSGLAELKVTYKASESEVDVQVEKTLDEVTTLVLSHEMRDSKSQANFRWAW